MGEMNLQLCIEEISFIHIFLHIIYYLSSVCNIVLNLAREEVGKNQHEIKSGKGTNNMGNGSKEKPNTMTVEFLMGSFVEQFDIGLEYESEAKK